MAAPPIQFPETPALAAGLIAGDRVLLGRAITLVESTKPAHQAEAQALLQALLPQSGRAHRIGITGAPGTGKSTLIDQLGSNLTAQGHKVAVLAVDPSSTRSGGSILGDKTRMARLAQDPNAFIRPSPSSGALGGVARTTRETMILLEAAGYDIILVETVGVGQSETTVAGMVDVFLVIMLAGAGDELQGIKKGILELADIIAVNKADGDNIARARQAASEYTTALGILTPQSAAWKPPVLMVSGLKNEGLDELWRQLQAHHAALSSSGELAERRRERNVQWMHALLTERLLAVLKANDNVVQRLPDIETQVRDGKLTPVLAVAEIARLLGLVS